MYQQIDGEALHTLFTAGCLNLQKNMETVNELNVFPVPDGDTGTNMVHSFGGAMGMIVPNAHVGTYMESLAHATLLNARGNSGVILSQFVYGLSLGLKGKDTIVFSDFEKAFFHAKEEAYKSVMTPTEGTMLTVIRESWEFLEQNGEKYADFASGMEALIACMKKSLAKTPELLPVLKQAGVVDSGGAGLVCFFEGMNACIRGEEVGQLNLEELHSTTSSAHSSFGPDSVMEYGYCTEYILQLMHAKTDLAAFSKEAYTAPLTEMGDSLVVAVSGSIVKTHIHTFAPEKVLAYARTFGELVTVKIENMSVQHSQSQIQTEKPKEHVRYSIVTVAQGEGIEKYFYEIGASVVINGGQTNNPSVEAFLEAFDQFDAEDIIVLPNNSNIILTANQAAELYGKGNVHVVPTKTIVEGYSALSMMDLWNDSAEDMIADMTADLDNVVSAAVTTATRDVMLNGVEVVKDHYIGIKCKDILVCHENRLRTAQKLVEDIVAQEDSEVIIVFHGKAVDLEEVEAFRDFLEEKYPLADIGFIDGGQEVYDYIISLE